MNAKAFLKQCISEVLVEPTDEGKYSSLAMAALLGVGAMKAAPHALQRHDDDRRPAIHMPDCTKELPSEKDSDAWDLASKVQWKPRESCQRIGTYDENDQVHQRVYRRGYC